MTQWMSRAAMCAVRTWTAFYTLGMAPVVRDARRAEIESDLWEHQKESEGSLMLPVEMIVRMLLGIPDDVSWSLEQAFTDSKQVRRRILAVVSSILLLASLWLAAFVLPADVPDPPPAPDLRWRWVGP